MNNPFIISEVGINHSGSIDTAKKLIDMAFKCGCDAVKFQKRTIDVVYTQEFLDSPRESHWGTTQRHQKEGLEFGEAEYYEIDRYCKELGMPWFASAWDMESQLFLRKYNLKYNKIASAMLTYEPLLDMVASERKHTFISTGMSKFKDIDKAVEIFKSYDTPFTLMHCYSTYPCEDEDCSLLMVQVLGERYKCPVGYSGHEKGILPSVLAVSLGATVIERHITLDRTAYGSDQSASLERRGLELLVRDCRNIWKMFGDGEKKFDDKEKVVAKKLRYFNKVLCRE